MKKKMNVNLLKLALKTELTWLLNNKKTISLILVGFFIPIIPLFPGEPLIKIIPDKKIPLFVFILGLSASISQYLLDSTLKDIVTKINTFYLNFQINNSYILISKIIICLPIIVLFFLLNIILYKTYISLLIFIYIILFCFNISIYTYFLVIYFFDSKSLLFSTYIPLIYVFLLIISAVLVSIIPNIIIQIGLLITGIISFRYICSLKKITITIL